MRLFPWFTKPKQPTDDSLSPVESALLASLNKEPDAWSHQHGKTPYGDPFIALSNREKGVAVNSRVSLNPSGAVPIAWQRDLRFSPSFAKRWHDVAQPLVDAREERDREVRAAQVYSEMAKRLNISHP